MGLYLAVFERDEELDGSNVGSYGDFGAFRDAVISRLESGQAEARFPTLIMHSDCDGEWTPSEAATLEAELRIIGASFRKMPAIAVGGWQQDVIRELGLKLETLYDCYFDANGEPLIEVLIRLARLSQNRELPILFQ
jgi:hypothetical protein